jgi:hypothetical protein
MLILNIDAYLPEVTLDWVKQTLKRKKWKPDNKSNRPIIFERGSLYYEIYFNFRTAVTEHIIADSEPELSLNPYLTGTVNWIPAHDVKQQFETEDLTEKNILIVNDKLENEDQLTDQLI